MSRVTYLFGREPPGNAPTSNARSVDDPSEEPPSPGPNREGHGTPDREVDDSGLDAPETTTNDENSIDRPGR